MRRYSHQATSNFRAPSEAEFHAFMEGFVAWSRTYWPEYFSRWEPRANTLPMCTDSSPAGD